MHPQSRNLRRITWLTLLAGVVGLGWLACLTPVWAYETLVLRHQRAFQRWTQRQPYHYRYQIKLSSPFLYRYFLIEVRDGRLVQINNAQTGSQVNMIPNPGQSNMPGFLVFTDYLLIDDLFRQIRAGTATPHSAKAFFGRSNPKLYATFVDAGWLPDGWQGCRPAFPQAHYNKIYGYPEGLILFAQPCSSSSDLGATIEIQIEAFEVLP